MNKRELYLKYVDTRCETMRNKKVRIVCAGLLGGSVCWSQPSVERDTSAYLFNMNMGGDFRVMVETLQGIVNRDGPRLFFHLNWKPYNVKWAEIYTREYGIGFTTVPDVETLIDTFREDIKGIILYDPEIDATRWLAVTLGGLEDALPVPAGDERFARFETFPVKADLTGSFLGSLDAYAQMLPDLMPRCNRSVAHAVGGGTVDGHYIGWGFPGVDYVVANRGLVFNLGCVDEDTEAFGRVIAGTPDQREKYKWILDRLDQPALTLGYGEFEMDWFDLLASYGHLYLHWGENLSFHAQVQAHDPAFRQQKAIRPEDVHVEDDVYYISFVTSEGDSMKGPLPFFFDSWFDPARGSVPMNWAIHPEMVRFPAMLEYYYSTATTNDYFVAMQVFHLDVMSPAALHPFATRYADLMREADMPVTVVDFAYPSLNVANREQFISLVNPLGAFDVLFERSTRQGFNALVGAPPVPVAATSQYLAYWFRLLPGSWDAQWQDMYRDEAQREQVIQAVLNEIEIETATHDPPYLIVVYTDLHDFDRLCELHREIVDRLDPDRYRAVRLDEGFSILRAANGLDWD